MKDGHGEKRSRKQDQLIYALLAHPSVDQAAKSVGISSVTAWRWMKEPQFQQLFEAAKRELVGRACARLQNVALQAVETLHDILSNGKSEAARVSAAKATLDLVFRTLDDTEDRRRMLQGRRDLGSSNGVNGSAAEELLSRIVALQTGA